MFSRSAAVVVLLLTIFVAVNANAKVFYSKSEALALAFPDAEATLWAARPRSPIVEWLPPSALRAHYVKRL